ASGRIEAALEPSVELGEILAQAALRVGMLRVARPDLEERRGEELLHLGHRGHEAQALGLAQRLQQGLGERVAPPIEQVALGGARARRADRPGPLAPGARRDAHEARALERLQQAAQVAGVELEPRAERAQIAGPADLPEEPRLAEGPVARQVAVVERA